MLLNYLDALAGEELDHKLNQRCQVLLLPFHSLGDKRHHPMFVLRVRVLQQCPILLLLGSLRRGSLANIFVEGDLDLGRRHEVQVSLCTRLC